MADDNVTAAGRNRTMVPANYDNMSDDQLLSFYQGVKTNYEKQLILDPDGKAFLPTTRGSLEGVEKQLRARGIHPDDPAPSSVTAMEVRDKGDALAAEVASNKGDALAQQTTEDQQEEVQQDLQESAEEKGAETLQDALKEKAQEKAEGIAKDKTKEVVKEVNDVDGGKVKETPKSGVRVRKASTTCFYYSNCFNLFRWCSC